MHSKYAETSAVGIIFQELIEIICIISLFTLPMSYMVKWAMIFWHSKIQIKFKGAGSRLVPATEREENNSYKAKN